MENTRPLLIPTGSEGLAELNQDRSDDASEVEAGDDFQTLLSHARSGSLDAVGDLIEGYRNYLLLIANEDADERLRGKVGASDIVQESMMHAQQGFAQFNGGSDDELKAWLRTILTNDLRKSRRSFETQKRNARLEVNVDEQSAIGRRLLDENLTPSSEAIRQEKMKLLANAISGLPDDYQRVIRHRNLEQLPFEDIGAQMGRSAEAARKLWARAIEALKVALNDSNVDSTSEFEL